MCRSLLVGRFLSLDQHYYCDEDTCLNNGYMRVRRSILIALPIGVNMQIDWQHVSEARKAKCLVMLRFLKRIAKKEQIEVLKVGFHPHHRPDCFDAETDFEDKSIVFCGSIDRITVLHELAHLSVDQPHTRAWAERLLEYHDRYLPADLRARADRSIALNYGKGATAYYRKYGKRVRRNLATIRS